MSRYLASVALMFLLTGNADAAVHAYVAGDTIAAITLKDQHDNSVSIDETTQLLLFATGMPAGKVVRKVIDAESADILSRNNAVFLSNISGMPRLIAKMFALPKMRKHRYSILLDRDGKVTEKLPSKDGQVTIIKLDKLEVKSITFTKDSSLIKKILVAKDPK